MTSTSLMTTYYLRYVGDGTVDLERGGGWEEGESEWEYLHSSEIQSWGVMTSTSLMTTYYLRYVGDGTVDLERGRGGGGWEEGESEWEYLHSSDMQSWGNDLNKFDDNVLSPVCKGRYMYS